MSERITAWQCVGCGRVEAPRPCVGVCADRRVELANAADLDAAQRRIETLATVVRQIAGTTPRPGRCIETWRALQARARAVLAIDSDQPATAGTAPVSR